MSEINLVILGLIKKQPQSAYDLQKNIELRDLSYWVKMSNTSIYNNVSQLSKKGYITGETIQNLNMPPKIIYRITEEGDDYLSKLMLQISEKQMKLVMDFNAVILNLECVDHELSKKCIDNIRMQMSSLLEHITKAQNEKKNVTYIGKTIMKQQFDIASYLNKWLLKLKESNCELKKED